MIFVLTRLVDGTLFYYCQFCQLWTVGKKWLGTGYTYILCEHCGRTLDDNYLEVLRLEIGEGDD